MQNQRPVVLPEMELHLALIRCGPPTKVVDVVDDERRIANNSLYLGLVRIGKKFRAKESDVMEAIHNVLFRRITNGCPRFRDDREVSTVAQAERYLGKAIRRALIDLYGPPPPPPPPPPELPVKAAHHSAVPLVDDRLRVDREMLAILYKLAPTTGPARTTFVDTLKLLINHRIEPTTLHTVAGLLASRDKSVKDAAKKMRTAKNTLHQRTHRVLDVGFRWLTGAYRWYEDDWIELARITLRSLRPSGTEIRSVSAHPRPPRPPVSASKTKPSKGSRP